MYLRNCISLILLGTVADLPAADLPAIASFAQEAPRKALVPDDAAAAAATKLVRDVYGNEFAAAKTVEQKKALAKSMLSKAKGTEDDPNGKFALLKAAKNIATQAMDLETAFEAIDAITDSFKEASPDIKNPSQNPPSNANEQRERLFGVGAKASVLSSLVHKARTPEEHLSFATEAMGLLDKAIADDQMDVAIELAPLALDEARKSHDLPSIRQAQKRLGNFRQTSKAYEATKAAIDVLKNVPDDPEANLIVGKYTCFAKGDWERGIPMLALGKDADLKVMAIKELKGVSLAGEQARLGDAWWDFAQAQPEAVKSTIQSHAVAWYGKALPELTGLAQAKVQKRIEAVAAASYESAEEPAKGTHKPVVKKTERIGGSGGNPFEEVNGGDMLVGLSVTTGDYFGHVVIRSVQAHYQRGRNQVTEKAHGKLKGKPVDFLAKPGYAVAGIIAVGGDRLDGFKVVFMRVKGHKLDPTKTYESNWVGGNEVKGGTRLGCNGSPVVGLYGGTGAEFDGLGLIQAE